MNKKEKEIYFKAFEEAGGQGKSYEERKAAADAAVKAHRKGPAKPKRKTLTERRKEIIDKAVDPGIAQADAANRVKRKKQ